MKRIIIVTFQICIKLVELINMFFVEKTFSYSNLVNERL